MLQLEVDAARGDQRRGPGGRRRGRCVRTRAPVAAMATPCGSCAWTMAGLQVAHDAREAPGGRQIELRARRQRDQVGPLRGAPPQLAVRVRRRAPCDARARAARARSAAPGSARRARSGRCRCAGSAQQGARRAQARSSSVSSSCVRIARCDRLQLPQLRVLQEHVPRVHRRDDQPGAARRGCRRAGGSCAGTRAADARADRAPSRVRPRAAMSSAASDV